MINKEKLGLADPVKDDYAHHLDKLVEVTTSGHGRFIGVYIGSKSRTQELVLCPSLEWHANAIEEPILRMNDERPREVNLRAVDSIGPVTQAYVEFYIKEILDQYRREKTKLNKQPAGQ